MVKESVTDCRGSQGKKYRQVSNIIRTLIASKLVDHSDVVREAHVGAAPNDIAIFE